MKRNMKLLVLQLALIICATFARAEKVMRPKIKENKSWSDNVYVSHSITFDQADPHVNVTFNVLKDLHDVDMHVEARGTRKTDPTYFFAVNTTINICSILNWRAQSAIGNLVSAYLKEYGNIVETCPIVKGNYYMHKFWIPEDPATAHLPEVDFEVSVEGYLVEADKKRTLIFTNQITGEAVVQDVANVKSGILAMLPKAG